MSNLKENLKKVRAFLFDLDGVISGQRLFLDSSGVPMRSINVKDGFAIHLAIKRSYPLGVISGASSFAVRRRLKRLGVNDIHLGAYDKMGPFQAFLRKHNLTPGEVLYMGDDLPDLEVMKLVGFPTCPADAVTEIKQVSKYISHYPGGEGCVRDIIEQVLRLHQQWNNGEPSYW